MADRHISAEELEQIRGSHSDVYSGCSRDWLNSTWLRLVARKEKIWIVLLSLDANEEFVTSDPLVLSPLGNEIGLRWRDRSLNFELLEETMQERKTMCIVHIDYFHPHWELFQAF